MNRIIRIGLMAAAAGTLFGNTVSANADEYASELSNPFTKHGLPVPGAYFNSKEKVHPATLAVSKSVRSLGGQKQPTSKAAREKRS